MKAVEVNTGNVNDFIAYCKKYAPEHDESYIPRDDFSPGEDEAAYILLNDNKETVGAISFIIDKEFPASRRFRIFHTIEKTFDNYKLLLDSALRQSNGVENIFCFILEDKPDVCAIWEELGFKIKRYSWVLERDIEGVGKADIPAGFEVRQLSGSRDEQAWCDIINSAFAEIEGHTHMLPYKIAEMRKEKDYMENGMKIAWSGNSPAGLLKLIRTNEEGEDILFIETLGVHRSFQGKGLGKALLRYGVNFGKDLGIKRSMLTVNAENSSAANLYFNEGFKKTVVYICYNKKL